MKQELTLLVDEVISKEEYGNSLMMNWSLMN
jgi:hypothetical protein